MHQLKMNAQDLRGALLLAAERFEREEPRLNALDGAIGDGDHGITVRIGFAAIRSTLGTLENAAPALLLRKAGSAFMGATGGAIGVIFGRALMAAGTALGTDREIGSAEFVRMLGAMDTTVSSVGKAKPGDKTILDAIHAAAGITPAASLTETMRAAYQAAEKAAEESAAWPCKVGRASRLGDRSIGHRDPGAVSFTIFLSAFVDSLEDENPAATVR